MIILYSIVVYLGIGYSWYGGYNFDDSGIEITASEEDMRLIKRCMHAGLIIFWPVILIADAVFFF